MKRLGSFRDVEAWLASVTDYEHQVSRYGPREYNLRAMRTLLERLGHPERSFGSVHIAGTKGKGSVAIMTEALLRAGGVTTGLFTSPHLTTMLERIQVGGRPVSRPLFVETMDAVRRSLGRIRPTYFELMTAAAFQIFRRREVRRAVVEVGLGGRLDTTNVLRPGVCVIMPVDLDHTDKLGKTVARIAVEKAGILKPSVPCVVGPQPEAAMRVIRKVAKQVGAPLWRFGREYRVSCDAGRRMQVTVAAGRRRVRFSMPFLGRHQAVNAGIALVTAELSLEPVPAARVREVFRSISLPGRSERVDSRILLDGAHNEVSVRALARTLRDMSWRDLTIIFGCAADKDAASMLSALGPYAREFVLTRSDSPRAMAPERLARLLPRRKARVLTSSVREAVRVGRSRKGRLLVTGSFYVVGEAGARLKRGKGARTMKSNG